MDAVQSIRRAGIDIREVGPGSVVASAAQVNSLVEVDAGQGATRFVVQTRSRTPYPNELRDLEAHRMALATLGHPLLIVPFVSEPLGVALRQAGWSWADACGNFDLRGPGLLLRQRQTDKAPVPKRRALPRGSGGLAIIRALIRFGEGEDEEGAATALAAQAKVSQPRASQVLRQLQDLGLVERTGRGRWRPDREALLDRLLAEYPGPRGCELCLYSLDSPREVALAAVQGHHAHGRLVVSADVGPDLVTGSRTPSLVILYADRGYDPDVLGRVEAVGRGDANVLVRSPEDLSVFPTPDLVAGVEDTDVPLADPSHMIWDLQELGGADRMEAAGELREWLLRH